MLLQSVILNNFRVFHGEVEVALWPQHEAVQQRPIVLFGGLNGAGKTSILTATRLALYGRQSLGKGTSRKSYQQFLSDSIHKSIDSAIQLTSAAVTLCFSYGPAGKEHDYRITRQWVDGGKEVVEELIIECSSETGFKNQSQEQLQAFLNDLIPVGVADLFFFDGEKIAELAEDEGNAVLGDAIRQLLGIDLINRLRTDLKTYLKDKAKQGVSSQIRKDIEALESGYQESRLEYLQARESLEQMKGELHRLSADITITEGVLDERGGDWARSRQQEKERINELLAARKSLSDQIRELLSGTAPLTLARNSLKKLLQQLRMEQAQKKQAVLKDALNQHLALFTKELRRSLGKDADSAIQAASGAAFGDILQGELVVSPLHDLSETEFNRIEHMVETLVPQQAELLKQKVEALQNAERELEEASRRVERAPDEALLKDELDTLAQQFKDQAQLQQKIRNQSEETRRILRESLEMLRRLRDKEQAYGLAVNAGQSADYAENTSKLLVTFTEQLTENRVKRLENEFVRAFQNLARKDDISLKANIDPTTFAVTLTDKHGAIINKQQLSAGEKQIYAIAMLEALGRTSGRSLPIIIDTPLGRLDSKHRNKLIKNYFPSASHQVIILSTDTEVDEAFFRDLKDNIGLTYEIRYNPQLRRSELKPGYFWQQPIQEAS
ncbi:MAG: DNA sulfur modification protein DndD [Marinobacterium sp.]|nr:DNA sulfur modification protein DndD [Marinobacterium sp.]